MILKNLQETEEVAYGEYLVRSIYNVSDHRNLVFSPHWHEYCEILLIYSGYLDILSGSKYFRAVPGDLVFFSARELHSGISDINGCVYRAIQFKWNEILNSSAAEKRLLEALNKGIYKITSPIHNNKVFELFNKIINICNRDKVSRPLAERAVLCEFLTYLFDNYLEQHYAVSKSNDRFDDILQYINENYCLNITTEEIAKKFSYNKSYFCRMFKQKMQLSPIDYINLCRIERAQALIRQNELNLSEIALQCGYNSDTYFSTTFKKIVGMSPKDWKAQYFKNNASDRL